MQKNHYNLFLQYQCCNIIVVMIIWAWAIWAWGFFFHMHSLLDQIWSLKL